MKKIAFAAIAATFVVIACGDDEPSFADDGTGAGSTGGNGSGASATGGSANGGDGVGGSTGGATTGGSSAGGSGGGGGMASTVADPTQPGPYTTMDVSTSINNADTGHDLGLSVSYPTAGPSAGPYPVVVFAHGFQLSGSNYGQYVKQLSTFGYVVVNVDYPEGGLNPNHVDNADDLLAALDWTASAPELAGAADPNTAGMSGHSLGGKLALLAASMDARVKASFTLDPVDGSMNCDPMDCPDVSALMPLGIPTAFMGETIDATGLIQACAPAADNFQSFYAGSNSPSLAVTFPGANHVSFLDNKMNCTPCLPFVCNAATGDDAAVAAASRAFMVAFYERHLRGNAGYDAYLTGAEAQTYVQSGLATIESK